MAKTLDPVRIVRTAEELDALGQSVFADVGRPVGWDSEASGPEIVWRKKSRLDPYRARLTGFSFSVDDTRWYVPVGHLEGGNVPREAVIGFFVRAFAWAESGGALVAHNLGFDLQVLKNYGFPIPAFSGHLYDSMVAAWLAGWGTKHKHLALKALATRLKLPTFGTFEEVANKRQAETIPVTEMAPYAGHDAWLTKEVLRAAWPRLEKYDLVRHYHEQDMPLVEIVRGLEEWGTPVNFAKLAELETTLTARAAELKQEFYDKTSCFVVVTVQKPVQVGTFKNGKPKFKKQPVEEEVWRGADVGKDAEVARWLYDELQLWPTKNLRRNDKGHFTVKKEVIEPFSTIEGLAGELAKIRLEYQKCVKLISTYLLPMRMLPPQYGDGHLHTSYKATGTDTQRFSSAGPNLMNIPSRTKEGKAIRAALIEREGWEYGVLDYSQIELRLMAHFSRDEEMTACYVLDEDIHQGTLDILVAEAFKDAIRSDAKIVNFSTLYRITAMRLAVKMKSSVPRAERAIDAFFKRFPRVPVYHRQAINFAVKHGYAQTIDGFKRFLDVKPSYNRRERRMEPISWGEANKAINTPVQGSAAAMAKKAMIDAHKLWVNKGVYESQVIFSGQEHDSITFSARHAYAPTALVELKHCMENSFKLRVPVVAEGGLGPSWGEAKS